MADMICPKCGRNYTDDLFYCLDDGTRLVEVQESELETVVVTPRILVEPFAGTEHEYCAACGAPNKVGSRFCKKCGQAVAEQAAAVTDESAANYPPVIAIQPANRKSYAPWVALAFGLFGLILLLVIMGLLAYNRNSGTVVVNANAPANTPTATPKPKTPTPSPTIDQSNINAQTMSRIGKTGTLTTDANLRAEPEPRFRQDRNPI